MITQLNPALPIKTPKGPALAHFLIDNGIENDIYGIESDLHVSCST